MLHVNGIANEEGVALWLDIQVSFQWPCKLLLGDTYNMTYRQYLEQ